MNTEPVEHPKKLGKYEVLDVLGEGAMGIVYRGFDPGIRRTVALKTVLDRYGNTEFAEMLAARFRNEAQAAGRLNHPGIVNVYDFGEEGGTAYIAMEFVQGQTLSHYLTQKVRFRDEDIAGLMSQLLDALHHAHEAGVCHRDIKPANIILRPSGQLKIADFGIARLDSSTLTKANTKLGTPAYMAPEQFSGEHPVDRRTDVYAAGVLLYVLLTNRPPFVGTPQQLMHKVLNESPLAPSQLQSLAIRRPRFYDELLATAMAKLPQDRFASALDFKLAIERAVGAPVDPAGWGHTIVHALINERAALGAAAVGAGPAAAGDAQAEETGLVPPPARHTVLIVDDTPANLALLSAVLQDEYRTLVATSGARALQLASAAEPPDLILLDVVMPELSGYEVCARLKQNPATRDIPVVFVSAQHEVVDETRGLEAGGVDYLAKPISPPIVRARVRTHLALHRQRRDLQRAVNKLESQATELGSWNRLLEQRVAAQVEQVNQLQRLRRWVPPAVAERMLSGAADDPLRHHRSEITVACLELRGINRFTESAEPDEVMRVLAACHAAMGEVIAAHQGTLERFSGDTMMVLFNDPVPMSEPALAAVRMALAMHARLAELARSGAELQTGIGIAHGVATIGAIGLEGRQDYGAIGSVTQLAARLCAEAAAGRTLVSQPVQAQVAGQVACEALGEMPLKGFERALPVFRVLRGGAVAGAAA